MRSSRSRNAPVWASSEAAGAALVRTTGCAISTGTPMASDPLRAIESSGSASGVFGNVVDVTAAVAGRAVVVVTLAGGIGAAVVVVVVEPEGAHGFFSLIVVDVLVEERMTC